MVKTRIIKLGLVQHACTQDRGTNIQRSMEGIRQASLQGAGLVLLQELHISSYFCQNEDIRNFNLAEPIPGPSTDELGRLAAELGVVIVSSLFERRQAGVYHNTAVVLDADGTIAGKYRKMHIPDDPGYYEKYYFTPGDTGFNPINTSLGRLGVLVCWDQWYPEAARLMALAGAEILLYPTAIGWDPNDNQEEQQRQRDAWVTIQRSHAIANGLPVAVCNRTGLEKDSTGRTAGIDFWGSSFVCGPQGEIITMAQTDRPETLVTELHLEHNEKIRQLWPYLRDRRIDAYEGLMLRSKD